MEKPLLGRALEDSFSKGADVEGIEKGKVIDSVIRTSSKLTLELVQIYSKRHKFKIWESDKRQVIRKGIDIDINISVSCSIDERIRKCAKK